MSHSISVLHVRDSHRAGDILALLAKRLNVTTIEPDHAGYAQIWLPLDEPTARDTIVTALDHTAEDWQEHITLTAPARSDL